MLDLENDQFWLFSVYLKLSNIIKVKHRAREERFISSQGFVIFKFMSDFILQLKRNVSGKVNIYVVICYNHILVWDMYILGRFIVRSLEKKNYIDFS